jgi:hypothetical protein
MSGKHTALTYSTYTVGHAVTLKWLPIERISDEWETYSTDLQHVHSTTCRNIEMASHRADFVSYTVRHAVTLKWLPIVFFPNLATLLAMTSKICWNQLKNL